MPTPKADPDPGAQLTCTGYSPPAGVAVNGTAIAPPLAEYAYGVGHVRLSGGGGAVTTTCELHDAVCLAASIATHVIGVLPTPNCEPDGGEQLVWNGGTPPTAFGVNVTPIGFPVGDVTLGAGHSMPSRGGAGAGGVVTVTCEAQVATCFAASTAVHVNAVLPMANVDPEAGVQLV